MFGNQLKTVISDVYTHSIRGESGTKVDALFSYVGVLNRIVLSPFIQGTTIRLVKHVNKQVTDIYFK